MIRSGKKSFLVASLALLWNDAVVAWSFPPVSRSSIPIDHSRRDLDDPARRGLLQNVASAVLGSTVAAAAGWPEAARAQADCMSDCLRECKVIAPKDPAYCLENCKDYCAQEDRSDGLSGSVSSDGGETGILGVGTVVKSEDRPPTLVKIPGLDFSSDKGRKLIGY
uniref:VDE lipocalin domain-containing protein n=1 Tax=Corethron hystrix TaxID=216773 RepID=A0A7S1FV24_9STRA